MNPNDINIQGKNSLHIAVQAGHSSVTITVVDHLQRNEMPIVQDGMYSPLHLAALYGHFELVILFITQLNIDPLLCNNNQQLTPLHCACLNGSRKITKFLIEEAQKHQPIQDFIHQTTRSGDTLVHYAALSGNVELTECLIDSYSLEPDIPNEQGLTPFHLTFFSKGLILFNISLTVQSMSTIKTKMDKDHLPSCHVWSFTYH